MSATGSRSKKTGHAAEQEREDIAAKREAWFEAQPDLDPEKLVFVDETGVNTKMGRLYGRAPKGERCRMSLPHGHWRTTTFTAALRLSGMLAPMTIKGAMDGAAFLTYVRSFLIPALKPGDIVVMDNLAPHKSAAVRDALQAAKADVLFLPPYSPEFNPIEFAFSALKAFLRKIAPRTTPDLERALADALDSVSPQTAKNLFAASGYIPE